MCDLPGKYPDKKGTIKKNKKETNLNYVQLKHSQTEPRTSI